jgi:predicted O-methyltransferase YrrM
MWNIKSNIDYLLAIRSQLGLLHGSDDLCMLMYSLVKRERPSVVVELGTGLGVTTVWMAAALQENGHGIIHTYDNGSHYKKPGVQEFLANMGGRLRELAAFSQSSEYYDFLDRVFREADVATHVRFRQTEIELDGSTSDGDLNNQKIDVLFSDFNHSPSTIQSILRGYLPRMERVSSIFFDSASTFLPAFQVLERIVDMLNANKLPAFLLEGCDEQAASQVALHIARSNFKLMHLIEKNERAQNSTAWLRIEPVDTVPPVATLLRS